MPRTPQQYEEIRNEKKKLILDSALELFADQGYASTSISQIAKKADISKGLMYNYFESKEELLKTIITNLIDEVTNYLDANHDNNITEEEALNFFDKYFELIMMRTEELRLFSQFSIQPEVQKYIRQGVTIEKGLQQRNMLITFLAKKHKEKAPLVLMNFTSTIKGISIQYAFAPDMFTDEVMIEYREYLKDMFVRNEY